NMNDHRCYQHGGPDAPVDASVDAPVDASVDASVDAPVGCTVGNFIRCDAMNLIRCAVGGGEESVACDFGCNMTAGKCNVCEAGTRVCDGQGRLITCSPDGQMQTRTS